jgi:hypothetical protein
MLVGNFVFGWLITRFNQVTVSLYSFLLFGIINMGFLFKDPSEMDFGTSLPAIVNGGILSI